MAALRSRLRGARLSGSRGRTGPAEGDVDWAIRYIRLVPELDREDPASGLIPEWLVASDVTEAVWLRLRRLTSATLCRRVIEARSPIISGDRAGRKGNEVAASVRSALGYWQSQTVALNAKVLTRYYALLQISIAEQLADPESIADLQQIQSHTEAGHGLWTISSLEGDFPDNYMTAYRGRGHFHEYCRFRGLDLSAYEAGPRAHSWEGVRVDRRGHLIALGDLFRRVPELQQLIEETLGVQPLSFRVGAHQATPAEAESSEAITRIGIYPDSHKLTADYLNSLNLPVKNFRPTRDELSDTPYFIGDLTHPRQKLWHQCLPMYKSDYCGTSIIVPFWGGIIDPFLIHFMTLYALSIVVRYLPRLWHEIEDGRLTISAR